MTTISSHHAAALVFLYFAVIVQTFNANIGEFDDYWKEREKQARRELDEAYHPNPFNVTSHLNYQVQQALKHTIGNSTRRSLGKKYRGPCAATNPIDSCWRCRTDWETNRERLADCVLGFARGTTGGKGGRIYVVTDPSDNDMVHPKPGTLRHAVIQDEPLWIIFARPMIIRLNQELIMNSHKTIDARGANVHIAGGAGITIQFVQNIIIHGLHIHHIVPGTGGTIVDSVSHVGFRTTSDGDGISIFGSHHVWIDHVSLSRTTDGLIDAIQGSTAITISNCHFAYHSHEFTVKNGRKFYSGGTVMMFGASDSYAEDEKMQVTVAFNRFGKGLVQRMPRCRYGLFHVVNNDYTRWLMYAIGGSMHPTIISQGNRFFAPNDLWAKEVTKRQNSYEQEWQNWTWRSENDFFMNGAYFVESGQPMYQNPYAANMIPAMSGEHVRSLARFAGPRKCRPNRKC